MAPIKFEEQIKDKLEQRTVTPSTNAWSKLSEQLDSEEKKNKKVTFWWLGIAASITALVFVSVNYFNTVNQTKVNEIIVKDEIKKIITPKIEDKILKPNEKSTDETIAKINKTKVNSEDKTKTEKAIKTPIKKQIRKRKSINQSVPEAEVETVAKVQKRKPLITPIKPKPQQQEFKSVVAELQKIKSETKNKPINQEVDSLLKLASRELLMDKVLKKNTDVVDSKNLLQDVEEDMGQSFRTRVYETLKKGYKGVKEAVVKRNN